MAEKEDGELSRATSKLAGVTLSRAASQQDDSGLQDVRFWINSAIHCGYLRAFCESQYCAENITYLIEIDRFRDNTKSELSAWQRPWREIDDEIDIRNWTEDSSNSKDSEDELRLEELGDWPSEKVPRSAVAAHVRQIWENFLSDRASTQICMPGSVLKKTKRRLALLHLYGPMVFEETTIDPLFTIQRDVLPRFLRSTYQARLQDKLQLLQSLPEGSTFTVRPPKTSPILRLAPEEINFEALKVDVSVIIRDYVLFEAFMAYMVSIVSQENLLCARALSVYHCFWIDCKIPLGKFDFPEGSEDAAWKIFLYFIAEGSAFEIAASHSRRKHIMHFLSSPTPDMFTGIEKSVYKVLRDHLPRYYQSEIFLSLPDRIRELQRMKDEAKSSKASSGKDSNSCFPMFAGAKK